LNSGDGFGGSCFPKDVRALISFMEENNVEPQLLQSTIDVNTKQKTKLVDLLEERVGTVEGKRIAVLGLAFKPGTDDVRKSPAINIIKELKEKGAEVAAYDPKAMKNMEEKHHPDIEYSDTRQEALQDSDAALLVTDWPEFDEITLEELREMKEPMILEGMKPDYNIPEENKEGVTWP
jgi:UDPglucose 6-dehydrogenase